MRFKKNPPSRSKASHRVLESRLYVIMFIYVACIIYILNTAIDDITRKDIERAPERETEAEIDRQRKRKK